MEDCHTTGETYECHQEFERKRRTNVCNSADVEDLSHRRFATQRCKVEVGGIGVGGNGVRGHICMSYPLCGESSVANLSCGESSGNLSKFLV